MNLSNSSENWLFILTRVIKTIETEGFQQGNEYLRQNLKSP